VTITQFLLYLSEWLGVGSLTWLAGLSPKFHRRPMNFLYQRRENIITFSMLALALLLGFFVKREFNLADSFNLFSLPEEVFLRFILAIVLLAPFVIALIYRRQPIRTLGWNQITFRPSWQLGLAIVILVIFLHGKIFAIINNFTSATGFLFLALLIIAVIEESVFRGYIFLRMTSGFGKVAGIAITILISTVWQAAFFVDFGAAPEVFMPKLLIILVQSFLLSWIMEKSGHALAPALYAAVANFMIFLP
jgi:membrane protease YdiL (CAAX protease family)